MTGDSHLTKMVIDSPLLWTRVSNKGSTMNIYKIYEYTEEPGRPWSIGLQSWTWLSAIMSDSLQPFGLWSGLPFPLFADLPDPGFKSTSLISTALVSRFFTTSTTWFPRWCYIVSINIYGSLGDTSSKVSPCQCRRCKRCGFDPWVGKIHWRRAQQPTPVYLPEESQRHRSLVGYR